MLGKEQKRGDIIFLNIREGKVWRRNGLIEDSFDFVEGTLERIFSAKRIFKGEEVDYWYIDLRDENGDLFRLGFTYNSGVFKSVVLHLAGDENLSPLSLIKIAPYEKDERTKVSVYDRGQRLSWGIKELPPTKIVRVGNKDIKDDSEKMSIIVTLVEKINNSLLCN